jgi:alpha-galactosidase
MGWNSWNFFAEKVTDKDIRGAADQMVATGMKDAGYIYVKWGSCLSTVNSTYSGC